MISVRWKKEVQGFIQDAYEYQDNTFQSHPGYYIDYFEMRMKQCNVIHNLHYEMKKIRHMPDEAMIISSYVFDMLVCVKEHTVPTAQLDELHEHFCDYQGKIRFQRPERNLRAVRCYTIS